MAAPITHLSMPELLGRLQTTLHLTQKELAVVLDCSARTVSRFYSRGGFLLPSTYVKLARACHPHDRELAAYVADCAGQTLVSLGLERAHAPTAPAQAGPPMPSARHMADSVVCAGAEALQMSPHAMRSALVAAFQRTVALGMSAEQVLGAMMPETTETPAKGVKGAKPQA